MLRVASAFLKKFAVDMISVAEIGVAYPNPDLGGTGSPTQWAGPNQKVHPFQTTKAHGALCVVSFRGF
jgi:hypothetical protein